jgi:hypothetical protein
MGEDSIEEKINLGVISGHIHALVREARMLAGEAMEVLWITKIAVEEMQEQEGEGGGGGRGYS